MAERFQTFDANDRFVVARDDLGYGVWRLEELDDGEPLERFSDDDDGYDAAAARWRELTKADRRARRPPMRPLMIAVIVCAVVWIVTSLVANGIFAVQIGFSSEGVFPDSRWPVLLQAISASAEAVTLGLTAIYVVLWLDRRRQEQGAS